MSAPKPKLNPPFNGVFPDRLYVDWLTSTALWFEPKLKWTVSPILISLIELGLKFCPFVVIVCVIAFDVNTKIITKVRVNIFFIYFSFFVKYNL